MNTRGEASSLPGPDGGRSRATCPEPSGSGPFIPVERRMVATLSNHAHRPRGDRRGFAPVSLPALSFLQRDS